MNEPKNPSSDESGKWASIALPLAVGIAGIASVGFFCFNKKTNPKTKAKRNSSSTTQSCPESVVSMAPERMSLTHSSVNQTNEYVPFDCVTQPLRENDAEAQRPLLSGHDSRQASNPSNLFQPNVVEKSGTEQGSSLSANRS